LASKIGVTKYEKLYKERALVTVVESDLKHNGMAFERFTGHGPIALLPMGESSFSLAWTMPRKEAERHLELSETEFLDRLQREFGYRAGLFQRARKRRVYPLHQSSVSPPSIQRTVLIGNAAHEVHPVAGQGFNLGLSDVAELAELIANAIKNKTDIGHYSVIDGYIKNRAYQTRRVIAFTDSLIRIFGITVPGAGLLRSLGLNTIEILPPVKRFLLRRTTGLSGKQTRLVRGLPLIVNRN
jgi:2-octaprenyl-6-methoxyphenol hydroxylase